MVQLTIQSRTVTVLLTTFLFSMVLLPGTTAGSASSAIQQDGELDASDFEDKRATAIALANQDLPVQVALAEDRQELVMSGGYGPCDDDPLLCPVDEDGDTVIPYLWEDLVPGMVLRVGVPVLSSGDDHLRGGEHGPNDIIPCKFPIGLNVITPAPIGDLDPLQGRDGRGVTIINEILSADTGDQRYTVGGRCVSLVIDKWGIPASTGNLSPAGCGGQQDLLASTDSEGLCSGQQTVTASGNGRYWRWVASNIHASTSVSYTTGIGSVEMDSKNAACGADVWILYLPNTCGLRTWDSRTTSADDQVYYSQGAYFAKKLWCNIFSWASCAISMAIGLNTFTAIDTMVRVSLDGTATCHVSVWDMKGDTKVDTSLYRWDPDCVGGDLVGDHRSFQP